jgi:hypothetical protein
MILITHNQISLNQKTPIAKTQNTPKFNTKQHYQRPPLSTAFSSISGFQLAKKSQQDKEARERGVEE